MIRPSRSVYRQYRLNMLRYYLNTPDLVDTPFNNKSQCYYEIPPLSMRAEISLSVEYDIYADRVKQEAILLRDTKVLKMLGEHIK